MKKIFFFICILLISIPNACADEITIDGYDAQTTEVQEYDGMTSAPSVSPANKARVYFNSTDDELQLSENGGPYKHILTDSIEDGVPISGDLTVDGNTLLKGTVGIGTSPPSGDALYVAGDVGIPEDLTVGGTSTLTGDVSTGELTVGGTGERITFTTYGTYIDGNDYGPDQIVMSGDVTITDDLTVSGTSATFAGDVTLSGTTGRLYIPDGVAEVNKLEITNTATTYDDIVEYNSNFGIQAKNTSGTSNIHFAAREGGSGALWVYADGEDAGGWSPSFGITAVYGGNAQFTSSDSALDFKIQDSNDYIQLTASGDVPSIVTVGDCDLEIVPSGGGTAITGDLTLSGTTFLGGLGYNWPASKGSEDDVIQLDSAGNLKFGTISGSAQWTDAGAYLHPSDGNEYVAASDTGTRDYADGDGDMYVENDIEIDGYSYTNDLTISGTTCMAEINDGNSGAADTIDWTTSVHHESTLTDNVTYTFTAPLNTTHLTLVLRQDGTGSRTVTWPASVLWPSDTAPTLTTTAGAIDIVTFYFDGSYYYGQHALDFQ